MNVTNAVVLTAFLVVAGRWSESKPLDIKVAVGTGGLAIFMSVLNSANEDLASKFAVLVLVGAVFLYGPAIAKKAGLTK